MPTSCHCTVTYLINFYYVARRDYRSALELSNDFIFCYQREAAAAYAEVVFQVQLSVEWSALLDDDIRKMLGLTALYDEMRRRARNDTLSNEYFFIPVCPMLFVL